MTPLAAPTVPPRVLVSFHYFRKASLGSLVAKANASGVRFFADSGAYSAATQGAKIDRSEYAEWCRANAAHIAVVSNLDVIGDAKASCDNLFWLRAQGVPAMPVFHAGEPWEYFDLYCRDFDYVALGGLVGWNKSKLIPFFGACFERAKRNHSTTVFHGFGMTNYEGTLAFPWYSCDSTSWVALRQYGSLRMFHPGTGRFHMLYANKPRKVLPLVDMVRAYGYDSHAIMDTKTHSGEFARVGHALGVLSWSEFGQYVRRLRGPIPRPSGEDAPGFHLYLAASGSGAVQEILSVLRGWRPRLAVSARLAA